MLCDKYVIGYRILKKINKFQNFVRVIDFLKIKEF